MYFFLIKSPKWRHIYQIAEINKSTIVDCRYIFSYCRNLWLDHCSINLHFWQIFVKIIFEPSGSADWIFFYC